MKPFHLNPIPFQPISLASVRNKTTLGLNKRQIKLTREHKQHFMASFLDTSQVFKKVWHDDFQNKLKISFR